MALVAALLGLGCGGEPRSTEASAVTTAPAANPEIAESPAPTPEVPQVSPVLIRVTNRTAAPSILDRSFGPADPLGLARLDGELDPSISLDQEDDAQSGDWLRTCQCACGAEPCPDCEPPETVHVTLAPGAAYEFAWNGRLRRQEDHPRGGACWTTFAPPPGRYAFTACTTEEECGRTEVRLPTSATIEISITSDGSSP
ncbi:MAG: hypothetical protein DRJ42_05805 [Deltaproteobacteria bacterium]|nr:MAG: hypothetical protein DRJ42_05805 [Deltaproteobacteria bacterium]